MDRVNRWSRSAAGVLVGVGLVVSGCRGRTLREGVAVGGPAPAGMVRIPPGVLDMGDHSGLGYRDERPVHRVEVSAFYLDRTEVSWRLWDEVMAWAVAHGYQFDEAYDWHSERPRRHPVCYVSWNDAVKWANARSEREGRRPAYYDDPGRTRVYRRGTAALTAAHVDWEGGGFRLPTEAEWEWAARGGLVHQHYPWWSPGTNFAAHFDGSKANFWESGDPFESDAECATSPVGYFNGGQQPPGPDMANGYGLYDMAGNVFEWCWDWYDDRAYEDPLIPGLDPRGPAAGLGRVLRGGSWISSDRYCRVAARYVSEPDYRCHCYGVRLAMATRP